MPCSGDEPYGLRADRLTPANLGDDLNSTWSATDHDSVQRWIQRARQWTVVVPVAAALCVLVVSVSVFTLAERASTVTTDAASLQVGNDALRAIDDADAQARQLVLVALLADGLALEVESSARVGRSQFDAEVSLARSSIELLGTQTASSFDGAALDRASAALDGSLAAVESGDVDQGLAILESDVLPELDALRAAVRAERDQIMAGIGDRNAELRAITAFIGMTIAFVVPLVAVAVYRVATRPPREEALLRARLARSDARAGDFLTTIEVLLDRVETEARLGTPGPALRRLSLFVDLERGSTVVQTVTTDVRRLVETVGSRFGTTVNWSSPRVDADLDPRLFTELLGEACSNAVRHGGGGSVRVFTLDDERGGVRVTIANGGAPIPGERWRAAFDQPSPDARRLARRADPGTGLVLMAQLAELLGIEVASGRIADENHVSLWLPNAVRPVGASTRPEPSAAEPVAPTPVAAERTTATSARSGGRSWPS